MLRILVLATLVYLIFTSCVFATEAWKVDYNPSLSYNGDVIAFERDSSIMVMFEKPSRVYSLTKGAYKYPNTIKPKILGKPIWEYDMFQPALSPDLNKVAWIHAGSVEASPNNFFSNIYITNIKTGKILKLTTKEGSYPIWSPDGNWIAYLRLGNIKAINIQTKKIKTLANKFPYCNMLKLAWLDSGIAMAKADKGSLAWYHINKDGSTKR